MSQPSGTDRSEVTFLVLASTTGVRWWSVACTTEGLWWGKPPVQAVASKPVKFPAEQMVREWLGRGGLVGRTTTDTENPIAIALRHHGFGWDAWATDTHYGDREGTKRRIPPWAARLIVRCRRYKRPRYMMDACEVLRIMDDA